VRVRLIHAQVRRLLLESGQWRPDAWGAPINQCHMAGTNLMFGVGVLDGLTRLGYRFKSVEREALIHLWRYAGYLLGVENELLIADEFEGKFVKRMQDRKGRRSRRRRRRPCRSGVRANPGLTLCRPCGSLLRSLQ